MDKTRIPPQKREWVSFARPSQKPLTRAERANNVKKRDFFSKYSGDARAVLEILLDKYMNQGITEVEDIKVLSLVDFEKYGNLVCGTNNYDESWLYIKQGNNSLSRVTNINILLNELLCCSL